MALKIYGYKKNKDIHKFQAISLIIAGVVLWTNFFGYQAHVVIATTIIVVNAFIEFTS